MKLSRRAVLMAAGTASLPAGIARAAGSDAAVQGDGQLPGPVTFQTRPSLPDKTSFPDLGVTFLNAAGAHPLPIAAVARARRVGAAFPLAHGDYAASYDRVRGHFARLINADPEDLIPVPTTQAGESFVASALGLPASGAHVISDYLHFVGSQMMYTDMQKRGMGLTWVAMQPDGSISLADMERAIVKERPKLVSISAASMINGFRHDLERVAEIAHANGALVHVDAIQSVGSMPIDVKASGVDSLCAGTSKWQMFEGMAFLYISKTARSQMLPPYYHWKQYNTKLPDTHMYPFDGPAKTVVDNYWHEPTPDGLFSMGYRPDAATLAGLEYSLAYIQSIGVDRIQAHSKPMIDRLKIELPQRGYRLMTPLNNDAPIVTVVCNHPERLEPLLKAAKVSITPRYHHLRISTTVFNDMSDVDRLLSVLPRQTA